MSALSPESIKALCDRYSPEDRAVIADLIGEMGWTMLQEAPSMWVAIASPMPMLSWRRLWEEGGASLNKVSVIQWMLANRRPMDERDDI